MGSDMFVSHREFSFSYISRSFLPSPLLSLSFSISILIFDYFNMPAGHLPGGTSFWNEKVETMQT